MTDSTDLVIIGAGLAGITAATAAVRRGHSVTLVSAHDRHPPDFRGEKLAHAQMETLDRLGLGAAARSATTAFDGAWNYRFGRLAERGTEREYGGDYGGLVNALLDALPPEVTRLTGRVAEITTGDSLQTVTLADGLTVSGRLLAVATGLGDAIRRMLGIDRTVISPGHSLSIGFDLAETAADFAFPSLCWGHEPDDPLLSYLTVFPMNGRMRGNLFAYRAVGEDWTTAFRTAPTQALHRALPGLSATVGPMTVISKPVIRPIDIVEVRHPVRDGIVLLGDSFSVICPVTGFGMAKAITDADVLVERYLGQWLATPGMAAGKLAAFYADPTKRELDARAMADSLAARRAAIGSSFYWRARRFAGGVRQRLRDEAVAVAPADRAVAL